jgi:DNA-directed RNA polymerase subunit RPC12/RpoP
MTSTQKIECADCGADLSNVTGSLTHETSACPYCGHQVFVKYGEGKRVGPGTQEDA